MVDAVLAKPREASDAPSVTVVIVNWNAGPLLKNCLQSLSSEWLEVIVVDNASTDTSLLCLEDFPIVRVIRNTANVGFAKACNQGAKVATGKFILFLNPDCVASESAIDACVQALLQDSGIGVVGVALLDSNGERARTCHRFPEFRHLMGRALGLANVAPSYFASDLLQWRHDETRDVDHVIGAFYMIRAELFSRLGGFDERFFVYLEDLDLSLRVRQAGMRVRFLANPAAFHLGGGSSSSVKGIRLFYAGRSRIVYTFKHFGIAAGYLHLLATLTVEPLLRAADQVVKGDAQGIAHVIEGTSLLIRHLPEMLDARFPGMGRNKRQSLADQ